MQQPLEPPRPEFGETSVAGGAEVMQFGQQGQGGGPGQSISVIIVGGDQLSVPFRFV